MQHSILVKKVFYLTVFLTFYFLLAFTGVLKHLDSKLAGGLFELLTIPLIVLLAGVFVFSFYLLFIRRTKLTVYTLVSFLVSAAIISAMFFVK